VAAADPNAGAAQQQGMATGQNGAGKEKAKANADQQAVDQAAAVAADCVAQAAAATDAQATDTQAAGDVVCPGSTVTLSGEGGTPSASSNQFPVGTMLKVTNLDNAKAITVPVTSTSGSCALLNNSAFDQIHEPGKQLIRNAKIQKVG
jgi:hypothetical protein